MSVTDGSDGRRTTPQAGTRRRAGIAIGAAAVAALVAGGSYVVAANLADDRDATSQVAAVASPDAPAASGGPATAGSAGPASTAPQATEAPSSSPPSSAPPIAPDVQEKIEQAREKMRKDGVEVKRPVIPQVTQTADNIEVTTEGSLKEGGIVRIMAAREDLTGQRELAYVAGGVQEFRGVPCSQTFQFSTNPQPAKKDNLLMCWRTTPQKSVVAIVVDPKGRPSRDKAIDELEKKWRSMG